MNESASLFRKIDIFNKFLTLQTQKTCPNTSYKNLQILHDKVIRCLVNSYSPMKNNVLPAQKGPS